MALPTGTEILVATSLGGGATVIGWFANRVVKIGNDMQQIKQAFYGDPDMKVPDGFIATLAATAGTVDALVVSVEKITTRLSSVENVCIAQHGEIIVRGQE